MHVSTLLLAGGLASALSLSAAPALAAVVAYLQIPGVEGASKTKPGWIEVNSFQWGVGRGISSPMGGSANRESSAPSVSEITITKATDSASPKLLNCSQTKCHYPKAVLYVRKAGGTQMEYLKYEMTDVWVTSFHATGGLRPTESLSLNFSKIELENAAPTHPGGSPWAPKP